MTPRSPGRGLPSIWRRHRRAGQGHARSLLQPLVAVAGALRTLHECGDDLPREFSVIALNAGLLASHVVPQLTTVALQSPEMGSRDPMIVDEIEGIRPVSVPRG